MQVAIVRLTQSLSFIFRYRFDENGNNLLTTRPQAADIHVPVLPEFQVGQECGGGIAENALVMTKEACWLCGRLWDPPRYASLRHYTGFLDAHTRLRGTLI